MKIKLYWTSCYQTFTVNHAKESENVFAVMKVETVSGLPQSSASFSLVDNHVIAVDRGLCVINNHHKCLRFLVSV